MEVILALSKMLAYLIGTGALGLAIILYLLYKEDLLDE